METTTTAAIKMPAIPLPCLARCPAKRRTRTYSSIRRPSHEREDHAASAQLGTVSAHSMILRVIEFAEAVLRHNQRMNVDLDTQQRIQTAIARLKMGATYVIPSRKAPPMLRIGSWAQGLQPGTLRQCLLFTGRTFYVIAGGRLDRRIVSFVCQLMTLEYNPQRPGEYYCVTNHCPAHDAVFEMTMEWNRALTRSDIVDEEVEEESKD
ncbi:hypothetical protein CERZMDRAFT_89268 [Cercospora zeae-maydis SCOH1-5]|uniref:Uncharacterized protein n=1 Tax=Cercospora zeae-maydis SCOH1-5 TaxID=717836 RepID=A0A6A6EZA6_9PEZI|nr:hypothetical protein CERZMDRAFT_89268 [Cercospora zeae-maydis SCOH1-5]